MTTPIERFDCFHHETEITSDATGDYVRFTDYEAALLEVSTKTQHALEQLTKAPELPKPYADELARCDDWIQWCKDHGNDWYGINFHQGMRSGIVYGQIVESQVISDLKASLAQVVQLARIKYGNLNADVNQVLDHAVSLL